GALRNGAPFAELPPAFKKLQSILLQRPGGDRDMVEILALVLHHDEGAVLSAVELALECGKPSKEHVLNLLGRLTEEPPPKPIPIPKGLRLTLEPQANVNRYDSLRRAHDAA
ncbi:TPA: IS21 family transposase, partial [Escherichia coli]